MLAVCMSSHVKYKRFITASLLHVDELRLSINSCYSLEGLIAKEELAVANRK